jgi:hypothetical protein
MRLSSVDTITILQQKSVGVFNTHAQNKGLHATFT